MWTGPKIFERAGGSDLFRRSGRGASLTSYALVVGLIAVVAIGAIGAIGDEIEGLFGDVDVKLDEATSSGGSGGSGGSGSSGSSGSGGTVNQAPAAPALSASSIEENSGAGASIGTLSASDPDAGQTVSFSLGTGGGDEGAFQIANGNELQAVQDFDFEAPADGDSNNDYEIEIIASDNGSPQESTSAMLTVNVTDDPSELVLCSSLSVPGDIGTVCDFGDGVEVILAGNTRAGASETVTPFYAARCDLGQSWNETNSRCECDTGSLVEIGNNINFSGDDPNDGSCDATDGSNIWHDRSNYPWNDGTSNWRDTELADTSCSSTSCTDDGDDGNQAWDVAWDGQENSNLLLTLDSATTTSGTEPHEAVEACAALAGSGWYLPAINEVNVLYDNRSAGAFAGTYDLTGTFPHGRLWSSSEDSGIRAWNRLFSVGNLDSFFKDNGLSVRCARR